MTFESPWFDLRGGLGVKSQSSIYNTGAGLGVCTDMRVLLSAVRESRRLPHVHSVGVGVCQAATATMR